MALDAVSLMRARVRGTPSWPGHDPETGYVGADRSDHSQKLLADGAGHTFLNTIAGALGDYHRPLLSRRSQLPPESGIPPTLPGSGVLDSLLQQRPRKAAVWPKPGSRRLPGATAFQRVLCGRT